MAKKSISIDFTEYNSVDELTDDFRELVHSCENNLKNAYAPYSNFKVSALCQLDNGELVYGTNQENAAYPSGLCAERVAIFSANANYPKQNINCVVVVTEEGQEFPFTPCGACRQVMMEYEHLQQSLITVIIKSGDSKIWKFDSVKDLIPFAFDGSTILKKQ